MTIITLMIYESKKALSFLEQVVYNMTIQSSHFRQRFPDNG